MRVAIILGADRPDPLSTALTALLRSWGCAVDALRPDGVSLSLEQTAPEHDLVVLRANTPAAFALAGTLHAQGAQILNPYPSALACRDRVLATTTLRLAGLPVPRSWLTTRPAELAPLLREGPLVVKPADAAGGGSALLARGPADLPSGQPGGQPYLVQRVPAGMEHRLYGIGGAVFCVPRHEGARADGERGRAALSGPVQLRDLAYGAGAALGLDLFGLDVIVSGGRPSIVDVFSFPGFTGVPDAALRVAEYVYGVASAAARTSAGLLAAERS